VRCCFNAALWPAAYLHVLPRRRPPTGVGLVGDGLCVGRQQMVHVPGSSSSDGSARLAQLQHEV
jgi:hypothetical protein